MFNVQIFTSERAGSTGEHDCLHGSISYLYVSDSCRQGLHGYFSILLHILLRSSLMIGVIPAVDDNRRSCCGYKEFFVYEGNICRVFLS